MTEKRRIYQTGNKKMKKRCQTCKYSEYEYNWHYEWSVRVCKHPKRHKREWDVDWGFLTDCPFWKSRRQNFEEKSTKKMEADNHDQNRQKM